MTFTSHSGQKSSLRKRLLPWVVSAVALFLVIGTAMCQYNAKPISGTERLRFLIAHPCPSGSGKCDLPTVLLADGQFMRSSAEEVISDFGAVLKANPTVKTVCFNSPGGDGKASRALGMAIAEKHLDTCFASRYQLMDGSFTGRAICNSACVWTLLAGKERVAMSNDVQVGIHSSRHTVCMFGCTAPLFEDPSEKREFKAALQSFATLREGLLPSGQAELLEASYQIRANCIHYVALGELNRLQYFSKWAGDATSTAAVVSGIADECQ